MGCLLRLGVWFWRARLAMAVLTFLAEWTRARRTKAEQERRRAEGSARDPDDPSRRT